MGSFGYNEMLFSSTNLGMRFLTGAFVSTVPSCCSCTMSADYDNEAESGPVSIAIGYQSANRAIPRAGILRWRWARSPGRRSFFSHRFRADLSLVFDALEAETAGVSPC